MRNNNDAVIPTARLNWVDRNLKGFQEMWNEEMRTEGQMDTNEGLSSPTTQNMDSCHQTLKERKKTKPFWNEKIDLEPTLPPSKMRHFLLKYLPQGGLLMSTDTILQKRNRVWIECQRRKSCHIDPAPIKASKSFAIDFRGSKVFKCSRSHPLETEKKGTKVFECQSQILSWKTFPAEGSESFHFIILLTCRQQLWSAGATALAVLGFVQT